jgi:lysozyme family protein
MANYGKAFDKTIKHEGGYNDIQGDNGGPTNFGVSLRFLSLLYKDCGIGDFDNDGDVDKDDIKKLTIENAKEIYFKAFWIKQKCDLIDDDEIAAKLFDLSVNTGLIQAAKLIQRACNQFGKDLTEDGKLGPKSIIAINNINPDELLIAYRYECVQFYLNLVEKNPSFSKFIKGWLRRAIS